ncbi:MAG: VOC family protein [Chthoniobacterales bacterium]
MFQLDGLDHIALAVTDTENTAKWYIDVLGFERRHEGMWNGVPVFIGKGATSIALFPKGFGDTKRGWLLHFALRADRENFQKAQAEFRAQKIAFEFQDHEISHSIYFQDPNGHEIEITTYDVS